MRAATLSIDVDAEFIAAPRATGGRARKFMSRAFGQSQASREFESTWGRAVVAERGRDALTFPRLDTTPFRQGDRLVLKASLDDDTGSATLYDGSALLVLHFLERADPHTIAHFDVDELPPEESLVIGDGAFRKEWIRILGATVRQAVEYEARTVGSLRAIVDFMHSRGVHVAIVPGTVNYGRDQIPDDAPLVAAEELLVDVIKAERAGRRPRARAGTTTDEQQERRQRRTRARLGLEVKRDLPRLSKMVEAIEATFGDSINIHDAHSIIEIVAGRRVEG